jgi:hypothetical protein
MSQTVIAVRNGRPSECLTSAPPDGSSLSRSRDVSAAADSRDSEPWFHPGIDISRDNGLVVDVEYEDKAP